MFTFDKRDTVGTAVRNPLERLPTTMADAYELSYEETMRSGRADSIDRGVKQEYQTILDDIEKRTGSRMINPMNFGDTSTPSAIYAKTGVLPPDERAAQVAKINEFIARNKDALGQMAPLNPDDIKKSAVEKALKARGEWAQADEYAGKSGALAGFAGGMVAGATDPMNIAATVAGFAFPPARGLPLLAREAAVNVAATVVAEPAKQGVAKELGVKRTAGEFAADVGASAVFGAGIAGTAEIAGMGLGYLRKLRNSENPIERANGIIGERKHEILNDDNPANAYAQKVAKAESGGSASAKASTSSATGKFQFTEGTWNDLAQQTGVPPVVKGQPDPRLDTKLQDQQFDAYTKRSSDALQTAGLVADDTNLYLSHFLGQKGAVDFLNGLKTNPDAPATTFANAEAAAANKNVFYNKAGKPKTAQDLYDWAAKTVKADAQSSDKIGQLPEAHIANYDNAMKAMAEDGPVPDVQHVPGIPENPEKALGWSDSTVSDIKKMSEVSGRDYVAPEEIRASQDTFNKQTPDYFDHLYNSEVDAALEDGRLHRDMEIDVSTEGGAVKKTIGSVLDELDADAILVKELTGCVEGVTI